MNLDTPGVHHVTAIAGDPRRNLSFYTDTLGLRLVKRSVNQDDKYTYHLFYGDRLGNPGTSMTFFPYVEGRPGQVGTGQVATTAFLIPPDSVDYWLDRLDEHGVDRDAPVERFDTTVVPLRDPDGLELELVAPAEAPAGDPWDGGPVPAEHGVRGFFGVTLALPASGPTDDLLAAMGFERAGVAGDRRRFVADGEVGYAVDLVVDGSRPRGRPGTGTVHHVAFRLPDVETAEAWREELRSRGLRPTEVIDRKWFQSVYVREDNGILFEFATESPGYTVDEDPDALGERLVLPEWLEGDRASIEARLPDLEAAPEAD